VRYIGSIVLISLCFATAARGQAAAGAEDSTVFRATVDLVALNVVVTDGQQHLVTGIPLDKFSVYEDGVKQEVSFFAASQVPLDLAILLDTSASMTDKLQTAQEAAIGFASKLRPGDRLTVVDIKDGVKVLHPLDEDVEGAKASIRTTTARGGTALYNGLYMALKDMVKQRRDNGEIRRQALAVLSDGDDTASLVSFDDVMEVAKQSGIAIYTITLRSPGIVKQTEASGHRYFSQSEFSMKALALETGARSFFPMDIAELASVYGVIAEELASQYALGYTPKNPRRDGAYRRVLVRVDEPGLRTRTRTGYVAPRADRTASIR
jgi:Ca-activated chloride channel family protein